METNNQMPEKMPSTEQLAAAKASDASKAVTAETSAASENDPIGAADPAAVIEAILFAAGCPVEYEKLCAALDISKKALTALLHEMTARYVASGVELLLFDDACQLCTKARYESYIKTALNLRRTGTLSNASLEVLAIVAYHQPVTRAYIEQVRGVDSSYAVSSLCDKELLEPRGRLDVPGRPMLYGTTDTFLRCFGLSSLDELPTQPELLVPGQDSAQTILPSEPQVSAKTETEGK